MKELKLKHFIFAIVFNILIFTSIYALEEKNNSFTQTKTSQYNLTPKSAYDNVRIKNLQRFYKKLQSELDLLAHIQNISDRKLITFGSARIRKFLIKFINNQEKIFKYKLANDIFLAGEKIGKLAFKNNLVAATGAGPGTMEVMPKGWLKAFIISNLPDGISMHSLINIVKNNPEQDENIIETNKKLEIIRSALEKDFNYNEQYYEWFSDKLIALLNDGLSSENIDISFSQNSTQYHLAEIENARKKLEIAQKLKDIIQNIAHIKIKGKGTQGIKINLPFEATTNPFFIDEYYFTLFFTRKLALLTKGIGSINFAPGFGTIDETFDAWKRDVPQVFYGTYIWEPILNAWKKTFEKYGFSMPDFFITDNPEEAFFEVLKKSEKKYPNNGSYFSEVETTRDLQNELETLFPRYVLHDPAIVFVGEKPSIHNEQYLNNVNIAKNLSSHFADIGYSIRIASKSLLTPLFNSIKPKNKVKLLQLMLMKSNEKDTTEELVCKNEIAENLGFFETSHLLSHRVLSTENSIAYVFLPGEIDTINILFDVLTRMQTGKIDKKPIILIDPIFWHGTKNKPGFFSIIKKMSYDFSKQEDVFGVPLISEKDIDFIKIVNNEEEAIKIITEYNNYSFIKDRKTEGFLNYFSQFILNFTIAA